MLFETLMQALFDTLHGLTRAKFSVVQPQCCLASIHLYSIMHQHSYFLHKFKAATATDAPDFSMIPSTADSKTTRLLPIY